MKSPIFGFPFLVAAALCCTSSDPVSAPCGETGLQDESGCFEVGADPALLPRRAAGSLCGEHEVLMPDGTCERAGLVTPCLTADQIGGLAAPIMLVDPSGGFSSTSVSARYPTIQAALSAAPEGATVLVGAGEFTESLVVSKPVTLRGVCADQTVIRSADAAKPSIEVQAGGAQVSSLGLVGRTIGISVRRGASATIEEIRIRGARTAGIGSEGDLVARWSEIKDVDMDTADPANAERGAAGIYVWEDDSRPLRAEIERSVIEEVRGDGISTNASHSTIRINRIGGLSDCCGARTTLGRKHAGIHMRVPPSGGGEAVVESNVLRSNRNWAGISYRRRDSGVIRGNIIEDQRLFPEDPAVHYDEINESLGIWVRSGSPLVQKNVVSGVGGRGVVFDEQIVGSTLALESNVVENCESHCLSVLGPGANYVIRGNRIAEGGRPSTEGVRDVAGGMWLLFGSFEVESNTVSDCDLVGIGILNARATLAGNRIEGIRKATFRVPGGAEVTTGDGVMTLFESDLWALGNVFYGNARGGMLLDTAGIVGLPLANGVRAALEGNAFVSNKEFGLFVQNGARADLGEGVRAGVRAGIRAGVRNEFRGTKIQVGLTKDAREGVRAMGPDSALTSAFAERDQAMDAVRFEPGAVFGGVRLAPDQ